ncbi:uncharacterized protein LOC128681652 [Plodia interpunctella]|uniref:uncharacterized protein LOC128681652 n=1 Tax=Plodia interpunctella TaxID=58824 RepID=UPI002367646F|nr:uncharacterized protein LOC128681652 [Plodia interpunctella]
MTSNAGNFRRSVDYNSENRTKHTVGFIRDYQWYARQHIYDLGKDVGCQCDTRGHIMGYSPRRAEVVYYSGLPKQVYAYNRTRSFTNVGVGSASQQKKRVRKIYLPETEHRGVGSSDLSPMLADRKTRYERENVVYARKRVSSKCVGGASESVTVRQCSEKLSPINIFDNSKGAPSPTVEHEVKTNSKDIGNNTVKKNVTNTTTQVENERQEHLPPKQVKGTKLDQEVEPIDTGKSERLRYSAKKYPGIVSMQKSSDSLEQHVHNLEDPSFIQSTGSSDPMENKLEKEYRKIFSSKNKEDVKTVTEKPMPELKSTSLLRRRFEALKRGMAKKEEGKKNYTTPSKESEPIAVPGAPIHRDISVDSDPPSLEGRSFSQTKIFSPLPSIYRNDRKSRQHQKKSHNDKKEKEIVPPPKATKGEADVKDMFKMWGEKFNFEEDKKEPVGVTFETKAKPETKAKGNETKTDENKKEGKRFFFFKKKSKDKAKSPPPDKKGVTTGRCEVKNCTILNRHNEEIQEETPKKASAKSDEEEIIKKNWLKSFIQKTIESRKSLQIRWNNKTYTTSSSTVFELMDNLYRQANAVIGSQSETSTLTSYYSSYHKHRVNFVQDVEAWMIPKICTSRNVWYPHRTLPYNFFRRNNDSNRIADRKWYIDKSKDFAQEIELVLNSKNFVRCHRTISSDYLRIDIPKGFFTEPSSESDKFATSNSEEVYKIIEYENPESRSTLRFNVKSDIGDYSHNDVKMKKKVSVKDQHTDTRVIETVIKRLPAHRDVVIQCSNVNIPKRCDVIGVGIITHRVNREIGKSLINTDDDVTDEESEQLLESKIKQCQFAESYLRDYYRHWMPLGIDLFPERVSDFHIKCASQETLSSLHNQGDGTKSCPNIPNDYHSDINLNPSNSRISCKDAYIDKTKIFNTFKSTTQSEPPLEAKRVLPKDSFEVLRKRMLYACGNRSRWNYPDDQPYSVPSIQDKAEQDALNDTCKTEKTPKRCTKRVSITKCDFPPECCVKVHEPKPAGILNYNKKSMTSLYTKHATVREDDNCIILPPLCNDHCNVSPNPKCSQKSSKSSTNSSKKKSKSKRNSPTAIDLPSNSSPPKSDWPCKSNSPCKSDSPRKGNSPSKGNSPCKSDSPSKTNSPCKSNISSPVKKNSPTKSSSPAKSRSPSKNVSPIRPPLKKLPINVPCKKNSPCREISEGSINEYQCPCTCKNYKSPQKSPSMPRSPSNQSTPRSDSPKPRRKKPCPCGPKKSQSLTPSKRSSSNCTKPNASSSPSQSPISCPGPKPQALESPKPKAKHSSCGCLKKCQSLSSNNSKSPISTQTSSKMNVPQPASPCPPSMPAPPACLSTPSTPVPPCLGKPELLPCPARAKAAPFKKHSSPSKIQGVHLKKLAAPVDSSPSKCAIKCPNKILKANEALATSVSEEQIMIRIKKTCPSTEEIRENVNFKVQDADGKTLYERRDYRADRDVLAHKSSLLGDVYKVNTASVVSTSSLEKLTLKDEKQAKSIANMIEISFGLKVTQGDKIAEINLSGDNDETDDVEAHYYDGKSQDVFIVNSQAEVTHDDANDKNDINIKIVIKNFDTKNAKSEIKSRKQFDEKFAQKISQKFHTVSTGYSDILGSHIDDMYSMHKTTIDLTDSKSQPLPNSRSEDEKEEHYEIIMKTLPLFSKESDVIGDVPMTDSKQKDDQSIHNSETYEVVNRSRPNIVESNTDKNIQMIKIENDMRNSISTINLNDVSTSLQKIKSKGKKKEYIEISGKESISDKIASKNVSESQYVEGNIMDEQSNKNKNNVAIKLCRNGVLNKHSKIPLLELKNTDLLDNIVNKSKSSNMCLPIQKSEICLSLVGSNEVDKSVEGKSERNISLHNIKNNSTDPVIPSLETNSTVNMLETDVVENKSVINEQISKSQESKNNTRKSSKTNTRNSSKINTRNSTKNNTRNSSSTMNKLVESSEININNENLITDMLENILKQDKIFKYAGGEVILDSDHDNAIVISETMQSNENCINSVENINNLEQKRSECKEADGTKKLKFFQGFQKKPPPKDINAKKITNKCNDKEPRTTNSERNTDVDTENTDLNPSQKSLRFTDTDDPDNVQDLTNTSDDTYDDPKNKRQYTRTEKKEMLKNVFEKATNQKWKTKGRMKRLKNMLKFILTSDSSDVDDMPVISKDSIKDCTSCGLPVLIKETDSMNNFYRMENVLNSEDEDFKIADDQSDDSDSSEYQQELNKCLCHTMAERLRKHGENLIGGCCCKPPLTNTVSEQTSCNMNNNDKEVYMMNCKAAEYIDVQTQNSVINSRLTNLQLVQQMESVMTSMNCSSIKQFTDNHSVSPYKFDKECEVNNVKTNTMLGLIDDSKIVIRTSDSNKASVKTEIIIGWNGKDKKKVKDGKNKCFTSPADILQSYETKKAVLEIYTEKSISKDGGERLVAKLPKFVYGKERDIESNYVNKILLSHDRH